MSREFVTRGEGREAQGPNGGSNSDVLIRHGTVLLTVLFCVEIVLVAAFQSPFQRFERFAFLDSGGELAMQELMRRGYRPALDFGYLYGLLPSLIGRVWYGLAGLTPTAFRIEVLACQMLSGWGLARFAVARRVGWPGIVLIMLAIPDLMLVSFITLVQTLEQALLIHALAEQAKGHRAVALALLTACCFVKPSLAFVQGLAVVIAMVAAAGWRVRTATVRLLLPSVATAAVLAVILTLSFGPVPVVKTILPFTGMAVYRISNYGFFHGAGREFWLLPHAGIRDYLRYELGFWILGTAVLLGGGVVALWRLARREPTQDRAVRDEMIATCTGVHLAFVVLLFGHRGTWFYSLPMLVLGLATLATVGWRMRSLLWLLIVLLLVSDRSKAVEIFRRWKTEAASGMTLNVWADPEERDEWARCLELARGERPALLAMCDGAALLTPGFAPPEVGYLVPGNAVPAEVHRKADQLASATVIFSAFPGDWPGFTFWPEIAAALDGCELLLEGRYVRVYRRIGKTARETPPPEHASSSPRLDRLPDLDRGAAP